MGEAALVLGGSSSGKSLYAQRLARDHARREGGSLFYLATMKPCDCEDQERIARHRAAREGWGFDTLEIPLFLEEASGSIQEGVVLLDSVTALLTNALFSGEGPGTDAAEAFCLREIHAAVEAAAFTIIVSDNLFTEAAVYGGITEAFRRTLGHLHQRIAAFCGEVIELKCGIPVVWKTVSSSPCVRRPS